MNTFCFWYSSLLTKWFISVEVEIWTKVFTKKVFMCKILKTLICEYRFFYIARRIFGNRGLIWVIQQNVMKVICFAKLKKGHAVEGTLYRFHSIHMTILFDLPSVLVTFVFGNTLIKTSFEAKVMKSNWKLKTMFKIQNLNNVILPQ